MDDDRPKVRKPNYPGPIAFASERGHFPGCALRWFEDGQALEDFFEREKEQEWLTVELIHCPSADKPHALYVVLSKTLDDGEREYMRQWAAEWEEFKSKKLAEREDNEAKEREAEKKAADEKIEMEKLGRKCKDNHAAVIDENTKLKTELKKLRKTVKG